MNPKPLGDAIDVIVSAVRECGADPVLQAKLIGTIHGYHHRWFDQPYQMVGKEQPYLLPVINPTTGRPSRTYQHAGRTDGEIVAVSEPQRLLGLEHKSTSDDIESADSTYWQRLAFDSQVSGYALARWQIGTKLAGTLYDVIKKPTISPKKLTKADRQQIVNAGVYFGRGVEPETRQAVAGAMEREDAVLYQSRVIADLTERGERHFQRRMVPRLDAEILEHSHELWEVADEMRRATVEGRHYRNSSACMQYGRACEFLGLCSGHDTPDSDRWQKVPQVHKELDDFLVGDGRDVITHSRIATFRACRRKEYYRHQLGLERQDAEPSEALTFGRILHLALAAWWEHFRKDDEHGNDNANRCDKHAAVTG